MIIQGSFGSPEESKANDEINTTLRKEKARIDSEIKLLLLGAGESGKSTIAKQMKFLFMDGFNNEERESYKGIIASNTVGSMRVLVAAAADMGIEITEHKEEAERFMAETSGTQFSGALTAAIGRDIKALWSDPAVKSTYVRSSEFQLNDSAGYYFDSIDRLVANDYQVSQEDVLRSRTKVNRLSPSLLSHHSSRTPFLTLRLLLSLLLLPLFFFPFSLSLPHFLYYKIPSFLASSPLCGCLFLPLLSLIASCFSSIFQSSPSLSSLCPPLPLLTVLYSI